MTDPVETVRAYVEAAQRARASGDPDDWERVRSFLRDDVVVRRAGGGSGPEWISSGSGADGLIARLSRPAARADRLQTTTLDVFGAGSRVVVEQLSTFVRTDGSQGGKPVCFTFGVEGGRIASISIYRNDATAE